MNRTLLELIKTKLSLIESCKQESFHTMMIYSESLPSLLVQCVGYIENKICILKDKNKASLDYNTLCSFSKNWCDHIDISILDNYKNILNDIKNTSSIKEFVVAIDFLISRLSLNKDNVQEYIKVFLESTPQEISQEGSLVKYRNEFAHGKINSRRLSIISKQDFYVYFGVLLLIDRCIDSVILHKK